VTPTGLVASVSGKEDESSSEDGNFDIIEEADEYWHALDDNAFS
jgi:hypothetical protein